MSLGVGALTGSAFGAKTWAFVDGTRPLQGPQKCRSVEEHRSILNHLSTQPTHRPF